MHIKATPSQQFYELNDGNLVWDRIITGNNLYVVGYEVDRIFGLCYTGFR
jgi:hypothetical protein